jgi:hypothetical protein
VSKRKQTHKTSCSELLACNRNYVFNIYSNNVADPGDTFAANTFEKLKKGEASIDKEVNAFIT